MEFCKCIVLDFISFYRAYHHRYLTILSPVQKLFPTLSIFCHDNDCIFVRHCISISDKIHRNWSFDIVFYQTSPTHSQHRFTDINIISQSSLHHRHFTIATTTSSSPSSLHHHHHLTTITSPLSPQHHHFIITTTSPPSPHHCHLNIITSSSPLHQM
jgi:HD-like signal output (HDOD) protein